MSLESPSQNPEGGRLTMRERALRAFPGGEGLFPGLKPVEKARTFEEVVADRQRESARLFRQKVDGIKSGFLTDSSRRNFSYGDKVVALKRLQGDLKKELSLVDEVNKKGSMRGEPNEGLYFDAINRFASEANPEVAWKESVSVKDQAYRELQELFGSIH